MPLFGFGPKTAIMMKHQEYSLSYPDGNAYDFDSINTKKKLLLWRGMIKKGMLEPPEKPFFFVGMRECSTGGGRTR